MNETKLSTSCVLGTPGLIRYGVIGVGMMGMEHIRNILCLENVSITCVHDTCQESIDDCFSVVKDEYPQHADSIQIFESLELLFKAKVCDIAVVATPNHTHHHVLMSAFKHAPDEMHILVEKPLCTTIDDCRQVIEGASKRKGHTFVGLEYSYMPPISRVINDVKRGVIGPVRMVSIREHRFPFLVKVENWNRFNANTGGTFVEKCCHFFDLFNRILFPHTPISVYASGGQDVNHLDEMYDGKRSDIFDNGFVVINYSGGRRACLDLNMFAEASHHQEEVSIVGDKGKLEAFLPQLEVRTGIRNKHSCGNVQIDIVDDPRIKYRGHHHGSSFLEHVDICKQVKGSKKCPAAGVYQGLLSVAVGIAAHISVDESRVVYLDQLLTAEEIEMCVKIDDMPDFEQ